METEKKSIELRSEKVRNIIGQVPPVLIRNGILCIVLVLIMLIMITLLLPYRETIFVKIRIKTIPDTYFYDTVSDGFFLSDTIQSVVKSNSIVGYIYNKDTDTVETIISPISGKLLMNTKNKDYVLKGKTLFLVIPHSYSYYGFAQIEMKDANKLNIGDLVVVKLYNHTLIKGSVENIDHLPSDQNIYKIQIKIRGNLLVENLKPNVFYEGQIILENISILKKIIKSIGID